MVFMDTIGMSVQFKFSTIIILLQLYDQLIQTSISIYGAN